MGRNNADFHGYEISYEGPIYSSLYGDAPDHIVHSIRAKHPEHSDVGHLYWHPNTGEIKDLLVHGEHEGKGIATKMYEVAQEAAQQNGLPAPKHSSSRTRGGDAWARTVGGALPPLKGGVFHGEEGA
jgi:GNAT superfamily N-acetyltransferase